MTTGMRSLRLGSLGMRGKVAAALTPAVAIDFAAALGTYLEGGKVVVACDTRVSSEMFSHAACAALLSCGCDVWNAGVMSAPEVHFAVPHLGADGALLIGAGHHPKGWNALVPLGRTGACFNSAQMQELLDIYHAHRYAASAWDKIGREQPVPATVRGAYLDHLCRQIDVAGIARAGFTVIADFCNGSGSVVAAEFATRLGLKLIAINDTLSGLLPHDPEPRPRSSAQVQSVLKPLGADVGFVFNSDMSRAAVVTSVGETLSEEYTFPLVVDHRLARAASPAWVVTNSCTTRTLDDVVRRHGGQVFKTRVGEPFIVDKMRELVAALAGDGSGSVAFGGHVAGYDSFLVMGVILEAMTAGPRTSAELAGALPRYHIIKKSVPCPSAHAYTLLRSLKNHFPDARLTEGDGFRFDWPDGWVHLRASATEPIVRMIVEWTTRELAEDRALQVRGLLERLVSE